MSLTMPNGRSPDRHTENETQVTDHNGRDARLRNTATGAQAAAPSRRDRSCPGAFTSHSSPGVQRDHSRQAAGLV